MTQRRFRCRLWCACLCFLGAASTAFAQPAYMVADLEATFPSHDKAWFELPETQVVGDLVFFLEEDGVHGRELWRSDGTPLGTFMVRDLCQGSCGSRTSWIGLMAALGDELVFVANDGVHGLELWRTDGTAIGTSLVIDLEPGYDSSLPYFLTGAAGQVFFLARTEAQGAGLWRTDGTAKGTYKVSPNSPTEGFAPNALHATPSYLYLCNVSSPAGDGLRNSSRGGCAAGCLPAAGGLSQPVKRAGIHEIENHFLPFRRQTMNLVQEEHTTIGFLNQTGFSRLRTGKCATEGKPRAHAFVGQPHLQAFDAHAQP